MSESSAMNDDEYRSSFYPLLRKLNDEELETLSLLSRLQERNYTGFLPDGGGT